MIVRFPDGKEVDLPMHTRRPLTLLYLGEPQTLDEIGCVVVKDAPQVHSSTRLAAPTESFDEIIKDLMQSWKSDLAPSTKVQILSAMKTAKELAAEHRDESQPMEVVIVLSLELSC